MNAQELLEKIKKNYDKENYQVITKEVTLWERPMLWGSIKYQLGSFWFEVPFLLNMRSNDIQDANELLLSLENEVAFNLKFCPTEN